MASTGLLEWICVLNLGAVAGRMVEKDPAWERSVLPWLKTLFRHGGGGVRSWEWEQGEPASRTACTPFHRTLASEGKNTYKSAVIDLLRQTTSYVCYMKGLLTSFRLEAEGGGERRNTTPLGRELMGW